MLTGLSSGWRWFMSRSISRHSTSLVRPQTSLSLRSVNTQAHLRLKTFIFFNYTPLKTPISYKRGNYRLHQTRPSAGLKNEPFPISFAEWPEIYPILALMPWMLSHGGIQACNTLKLPVRLVLTRVGCSLQWHVAFPGTQRLGDQRDFYLWGHLRQWLLWLGVDSVVVGSRCLRRTNQVSPLTQNLLYP